MADRLLLESGAPDGYLLEDGTGVLLLQFSTISGTLTATLDDVVVAISQSKAAAGNSQALAATLADVVVAASQAARHPQSLSVTLDAITVAAAQTSQHPQSLAATLADVTVAGSQALQHAQSGAAVLDGITAAGVQVARHPQILDAALDSVAVDIQQSVSGSGATYNQILTAQLDDVSLHATQVAVHSSSIGAALDSISVAMAQSAQAPPIFILDTHDGGEEPRRKRQQEQWAAERERDERLRLQLLQSFEDLLEPAKELLQPEAAKIAQARRMVTTPIAMSAMPAVGNIREDLVYVQELLATWQRQIVQAREVAQAPEDDEEDEDETALLLLV